MSAMNDKDRILLSRLVDGELGELERRSLEARLEREPALREELEALEGSRAWFGRASAGEVPVQPAPSFAERLMAEVRRQPDPAAMAAAQREAGVQIEAFARRLTLAALLLLGAAILLTAALWTAKDADELEAAPSEIDRVTEQIDEAIHSGASERGAVVPRVGRESGR